MSFSNLSFIFMFLPALLLIYRLTPAKYSNLLLLVASLFFYAWGNVWHVGLLLVVILINYLLGIYIDQSLATIRKRRLIETLILNVGFLAYMKYYGFFLNTISAFGLELPSYQLFSIPLGISFFTFSILSYQIDVYRKKIPAERHLLCFALFVSFFPKLVMGPVERYEPMRKQFINHPVNAKLFEQGCGKFLCGLAMKVILADTMGVIWSHANATSPSVLTAWLGILAYTLQIYFDFQGYTQMAIGLGRMFGFHLSENFHYPYMASSITDFWRRWHITLSLWFRDYVYIPLGGSRKTLLILLRNLMIVWFLTGFWHGASWNFIFWGCYYGVLLILEKFVFYDGIKKLKKGFRWLYTMLAVMIGWVFFASNNLSASFSYLGSMLMLNGNAGIDDTALFLLYEYGIYFLVAILCCTPVCSNYLRKIQQIFKEQLWFLKPVVTACLMIVLLSFLLSNTYQSFLYFQF